MQTKFDLDFNILKEWQTRANLATREAHRILAKHEQSSSRVVILEDLLKKLEGLPVDVQDYFKEATSCLQNNLLRAAIVLSWAGFFHVLAESSYLTQEASLRQARPKWQFKDLIEMKENYAESQILDVLRVVKIISKAELRVYQGQLAVRNQCAHPTLYRPSLNSALGYVDDMIRQAARYL